MEYVPLPRSFFSREPAAVARDLLGKLLVRRAGRATIAGEIAETEAYLSKGDEAAHGYKGKSARNASLYKEAGHAYVHAMRQYFLLDAVTQEEGTPSSVLIRAAGPAHGPGKVGIAFKITKALDGADLTDARSVLYIAEGTGAVREVRVSPRVGISKSKELPLRFYYAQDTKSSRKRER
jgi:DNA-3-methyladenine glycosylase